MASLVEVSWSEKKILDRKLRLFRRRFHKTEIGSILMSYRQAEVNLSRRGGEVFIASLWVDPFRRSKGHGNRALRTICAWADREGIKLSLWPHSFDSGPLSTKNLARWYSGFGFVKQERQIMRRTPLA